jgi:hypothetical protein
VLASPATLAKQFVIRDHGRVDLGVPPGYLLVLLTAWSPDRRRGDAAIG